MYLNIKEIKKHLNIDEDFTEDDKYLTYLGEVAEQVVARHIDDDLDELCGEYGGVIPTPLHHAILLYIGDLYIARESNTYASVSEVPFSYDYILSLYKNYKGGRCL